MTEKTAAWYAEQYVSRMGMKIVPIEPGRKFPTTNDWGNHVIEDAKAASDYYTSSPDWNIGLALGPSGFCSLDIDCEESVQTILSDMGINSSELDNYPTIQGRDKGRRLLFRVPEGVELAYAKLNWPTEDGAKQYTVMELRAACDGKQRQDVLPPSTHPDTGKPYKWLVQPAPSYESWPEPPDWLLVMWQQWDRFKPQLKGLCPWSPDDTREPAQPKASGSSGQQGSSVIDDHLSRVSLPEALERYGYRRIGRRYLSPHTTTKLPGVVLFSDGASCWVHHASDPLCSEESGRPVNAFDLYAEYEHGGDVSRACKALAREYGFKPERPEPERHPDAVPPPPPEPSEIDKDLGSEPPITHQDKPEPYRPFKALGYDGDHYYYLPRGTEQIVAVRRGSHTSPAELMAMAPFEWWQAAYPKGDNGGTDWQVAASDCMRMCERRGVYSLKNVRGRGAWYDNGSSVLHLGDRLVVDGESMAIADHDSQYVYTRQSPMESTIGAREASNADGKQVFDLFGRLNWSKPVHGWLAAGWVALAPVCGALSWRPHLWLTAPRGAGKAQPMSSSVLTPFGWKRMGDINVGDRVTTPDNGHAHVMAVYPQGEKQVYKLTFSDGRSARATADHLWKVRDSGIWRLRTTAQLRARMKGDSEWSTSAAIPLSGEIDVTRGNKTILPLHPYVLGAVLGDGHLAYENGKKAGQIRLTSFDHEVTERVRQHVPDWMGLFDTNKEFSYRFGDLSKRGRRTRELIKELRILGRRSHEKFIPDQYLEASIEDRYHLLQGLMDTDGTAGRNGHLSYTTTSPRLRDDFCYLVRSLGGVARVGEKRPVYTHNGERREGRLAYSISVRLRDREKAFTMQRKLDRVSGEYQYADRFYLGIESIEPDGLEESQCIAIDHPDRLYVTDDFVVTHNTWAQDHLLNPLLGQSALIVQGGTTEAGIRQHVKQDARPVIFDEAEAENQRGQTRMQGVIELARQSSSESSAEIIKGTAQGGGMAFRMRSMFLLGSINVSLVQAADESRFTVVSLQQPDKSPGAAEAFKAFSREVDALLTPELCASVRARTYALIPTIRENAATMAQAVAEVMSSQRIGDQFGTLLAGAVSLSRRDLITLDEARQWVSQIDLSDAEEQEVVSDEENCLNTILQTQIRMDVSRGVYTRTVAEAIQCASGRSNIGQIDPSEANGILARHGLQVDSDWLLVSNTHTELAKILRDTPWAAGWKRVLSRLPGSGASTTPARFAGVQTRVVRIPLAGNIG